MNAPTHERSGSETRRRDEQEQVALSPGSAFPLAVCAEMVFLDLTFEERAGRAIGEVQVADVPSRCEPGTGEVYYPAIACALERIDYTGTVGLEAYASGDDVEALERFHAAFASEPG